ncbi:BREX-1 system adenine-specific DNA-methyltransferase PglX [Halorhodospira halochloris]|uniref:BREX-1 system adenine-specific DNA-methyltransferase PglX n=1 Tax=Halorhodospira halochloris TaxID=1052 RepID=UPI001EE93D6D|nr:BREX-1 system adenine-specific DNA-methyltransferase PglX [Halorhodospira halochloris]MCG5549212.1 BREX-1 system adenine-specific DNA-methyltransferase PglX [Halorhodospira halochloris]
MSRFLRLLNDTDKAESLATACARVREGHSDSRVFDVDPESFKAVPGEPFAYWVSEAVRKTFVRLPRFQDEGRTVKQGLATADDFRFVRLWWEIETSSFENKWAPFAKGGAYSPYYADIYLAVNLANAAAEMDAFSGSVIRNPKYYHRPGLTWPRRTTSGLSLRAMPAGCIFADKGPAAFVAYDYPEELLALLALANSHAFGLLVALQLAAGDAAARSYEVGVIQRTPVPELTTVQQELLAELARTAWSLKRKLDTTTETSHAFLLPVALRARLSDYDPSTIEAELNRIQTEIDDTAFDLYGFSEADRKMAQSGSEAADIADVNDEGVKFDDQAPSVDPLLSWAVGVAFGRFDWRLATGERTPPAEPEPFDPLPAKSPGMLPDEATPFHKHPGILVDDPGHDHDLPRLVEAVLEQVDVPVDRDIRRWVRKDFFKYHLQQYSKSRRKAPIYWPLTTASGDYTVWVYYPMLTGQTLFTAVNDFVEPKLQQVAEDIAALRHAGSNRSRQDEQRLVTLVDFEAELAELRDTLLAIAPGYKPEQDDGVQITAAPLWSLFRHTPWRKELNKTWERLERGDYDWAKLAMAYWPERVREKCETDQSLAIAHDLEHLYDPPATVKYKQGKKS